MPTLTYANLGKLPIEPTLQDFFSNGEAGAAYAFPDLSSLYQDAAGTVPVTAIGQQVYRVNDISGRGNHLLQATALARPRLGRTPAGGVRNLLLATAAMATQSLTVTAVAHTLRFSGTGTVTLSGASTAGPLVGTGVGNRVSLTFTPTAGTLTLTVSGNVTEAQLEIGAGTAYQAVTDPWDVTEAGKRDCYCLYGDGIDDTMATASNVLPVRNGLSLACALQFDKAGIVTGPVITFGISGPSTNFCIAPRRNVNSTIDYVSARTTTGYLVRTFSGFSYLRPFVIGGMVDNDIISVFRSHPDDAADGPAPLGSAVSAAHPLSLFPARDGIARFYGGLVLSRPFASLEREFAMEEYAYLSGAIE